MTDHDADDQWQDEWMAMISQMGELLANKHRTNPYPHRPVLPESMKYLMTELWDHGFSQAEIRDAFEAAIRNLSPYAGEEERRA